MNLKPILNRIIIKEKSPVKETAGGLIIASAKNEGITEGTVMAAGPGLYNEKGDWVPMEISVGSNVLYNTASGVKFKLEEFYKPETENEL